MGEIFESLEMIVLVGKPVGVHLPEHPLGGHLKKAASAPGIADTISRNL